MKKSFSILILVVVIFVFAAMAYWFLTTQIKILGENNLNAPGAAGGNNLNQNLLPSGENVFATDDFSLTYPVGWRSVPAMAGVSAMIVKGNENISDPEAKKMNFQSYLAVSYDSSEGKTKDEVAEYLKTELRAAILEAIFSRENFLTINGREAYATEMTFRKSGIDFHILMIAVWGNGNDLWILSHNTLEELWQGYTSDFEKITQSFIVK
jgi:flagellar basal body-associated protein FliL